MRKLVIAVVLAGGLGCFPLEDILIDDGTTRVDTLVIDRPVPQPPDTLYCVWKHHHLECRK